MATLEDKVKTWLTDQGFPLEMRVADILLRTNVHPDHYRTFKDPATGKTREVDLLGYIDCSKVSTHLVLECKHSRDKPWVLFCTLERTLLDDGYVLSVPSTPRARQALETVAKDDTIQKMSVFHAPKLIGFRLMRAHTDNQDAAHHAVQGVATASVAIAAEIGRHGHSVIYPSVIVVDSPLLQCHLPPGNTEVEIMRIPRGVLFHPLGDANHVLVHVVHVDALEQFLIDAKHEAGLLNQIVPVIPRPANVPNQK